MDRTVCCECLTLLLPQFLKISLPSPYVFLAVVRARPRSPPPTSRPARATSRHAVYFHSNHFALLFSVVLWFPLCVFYLRVSLSCSLCVSVSSLYPRPRSLPCTRRPARVTSRGARWTRSSTSWTSSRSKTGLRALVGHFSQSRAAFFKNVFLVVFCRF